MLGSGSGGNSMAVRSGDTLLLVDLGFSFKEQKSRLAECGVDISEVSAVLFTHDHSDHCRGVGTFHTRLPGVPLVANGDTADAIARQTGVNDGWTLFENGEPFDVGGISVTPFPISHDAADPVGYLFEADGASLFVGTDMGTVTANVRSAFSRATCAVLESNHDVWMLQNGSYPYALKWRILSDIGHLSNDTCAHALPGLVEQGSTRFVLAHLSKENNIPALAYQTSLAELTMHGMRQNVDFQLSVAPRENTGGMMIF